MEIFKLFEATIPSGILQPGGPEIKKLGKGQLLNNCDQAMKCLASLICSKESEIAYRRDLLNMLEKSKDIHSGQLQKARQTYEHLNNLAPHTVQLRESAPTDDSNQTHYGYEQDASSAILLTSPFQTNGRSSEIMTTPTQKENEARVPAVATDRNNLDDRLSIFLKSFPTLHQPTT